MPLNRFLELITKWTEPQISADENELRYWQDRISFSFLLFGVVFGFLVLIFSVLLSIKEELWAVAFIDIAIYLWVIILFFRRSISYVVRNTSIVAICYLLGVTLLATIGPFGGAGPVWLFFFPIVAGLLANIRYSILSLFINIITLVAIGFLLSTDWYEWPISPSYPTEKWFVLGLNFILLNGISTIAITLFIGSLRQSLQEKKLTLNKLEDQNIQLQNSNRQLLQESNDRKRAETSLLKSEEALKESEIKFEELVNLLPIAYLYIDNQNILRFVNDKAFDFFDISRTQIGSEISWEDLALINVNEFSDFNQIITNALEGKDNNWAAFTFLNKEKQEIPVETYISAVTEDERITGYQFLIVDISDRQEKEKLRREKEVAEKANIAISEWVDFIAHELKTPTTGIRGFAEIGIYHLNKPVISNTITKISDNVSVLKKGKTETISDLQKHFNLLKKDLDKRKEKLIDYLKTIISSANRLTKLVNDLLDLSKLQAKSMSFNRENYSLLAIIEEAHMEMESLLIEKGLTITVQHSDLPLKIKCDTFRIGQVFRNLFSNAIKFSPSGKQIKVIIKQAENVPEHQAFDLNTHAFQVSVHDEGVGIPKDQLNSIFEKFKQSRKTRIGEGTGLGLPICKEIIIAHNGIIWAESEKEQGTQLHFILPYE